MTIKAVIIGTGMAGRTLAAQLAPLAGVRLVAAMDIDPAAVRDFCRSAPGAPRPYTHIGQMVREQSPDLAIVATPNAAHAQNVLDAVEGHVRNIYCEKPIAVDVDDALRMVQAVERFGVRTSMGFSGLQAGYRRLIDLAAGGRLGRILSIWLHSYRGYGFWGVERINQKGVVGRHAAVSHPQMSGGWTIHHACHLVFLLGRMAGRTAGRVQNVFGHLSVSDPACPSEELINATLVYENGISATILDSIGSFRGLRCGLIGTRATALMEDDFHKTPGETCRIRIRHEGQDQDIQENLPYDPSAPTRLSELIDAIRADGPSPITFREGLENLQICQAIRQSSVHGTTVRLPPSA